MNLRTVTVTRYVTPLREGGSLPAIVEADDDGMYVLKFRGAGQGPKVLVAELIAGGLAMACGLRVPEIVFAELDPDLARTEPDPEIQQLLRASGGLNLAVDYLPGSVMFNPVADSPEADLTSRIVWFDAFVTNVDRTARNTNMLMWHRNLWLIDHGAAFYFHHNWTDHVARSRDRFPLIRDHVLLPRASEVDAVDSAMALALTEERVRSIVDEVPDAWLEGDDSLPSPADYRRAYVEYLMLRLHHRANFLEEVQRARSGHV